MNTPARNFCVCFCTVKLYPVNADSCDKPCARLKVDSLGRLLSGETVEDMKRGAGLRNPAIVWVFRELPLLE